MKFIKRAYLFPEGTAALTHRNSALSEHPFKVPQLRDPGTQAPSFIAQVGKTEVRFLFRNTCPPPGYQLSWPVGLCKIRG